MLVRFILISISMLSICFYCFCSILVWIAWKWSRENDSAVSLESFMFIWLLRPHLFKKRHAYDKFRDARWSKLEPPLPPRTNDQSEAPSRKARTTSGEEGGREQLGRAVENNSSWIAVVDCYMLHFLCVSISLARRWLSCPHRTFVIKGIARSGGARLPNDIPKLHETPVQV